MAANVAGSFDAEVRSTQSWMASPRFEGITRLYSARQVVEQRGALNQDHTVARLASERFYARLRELFEQGRCISTFGPYSPGQAVAMKRAGIEGIYLGGWATSAKGSLHEDPGPDLAQLPAGHGSRRGGRVGPSAVDRRSQPAVRPVTDEH